MTPHDLTLDMSWVHQLSSFKLLTGKYHCKVLPLLEDVLSTIYIDNTYDTTYEVTKGELLEYFYNGGMSLNMVLPDDLFERVESELDTTGVSDNHLELLETLADLGEQVVMETVQQLRNTAGVGTYYLRHLTLTYTGGVSVWKKDI